MDKKCCSEYNVNKKQVKVLSIDGGGIRGILPLVILDEIEKRTGKQIYELFDYVAGTSTGGIIAAGLTVPCDNDKKKAKHRAKDILNVYLNRGESIFSPKNETPKGFLTSIIFFVLLVGAFIKINEFDFYLNLPSSNNLLLLVIGVLVFFLFIKISKNIFGMINSLNANSKNYNVISVFERIAVIFTIFDWLNERIIDFIDLISKQFKKPLPTMGLSKVLNDIFGNKNFEELIKPTIITAYQTESRMARVFNSVRDENAKTRLVDITKSTSAAPMFFPAHAFKIDESLNDSYIDGGVFANNPLLCVYTEILIDHDCERLEKTAHLELEDNEKFCQRKKEQTEINCLNDKIVVVSLGTGGNYRPYLNRDIRSWGPVKWGLNLFEIVSDGINDIIQFQMKVILKKGNYFRLQPTLEEQFMHMDDASFTNILSLKSLAEHYVSINSQLIDKVCEKLVDEYNHCCNDYKDNND